MNLAEKSSRRPPLTFTRAVQRPWLQTMEEARRFLTSLTRPTPQRCCEARLFDELDLHLRRDHAFAESLVQHQLRSLAVSVRVTERAVVDPHCDETVGRLDRHVARELHRVVQGVLPVVHRKLDAATQPMRDFTLKLRAEVALDGVAAHRQRQSRLFLPPRAEVDDLVQSLVAVGQLALVDQQAGVVIALYDFVNYLIEWDDAVIEFRRV